MEHDPTRMCELLVGLPDVNVEGVGDWPRWLRIAITTRAERPACPTCAGAVWHHDDLDVEQVGKRLLCMSALGRHERRSSNESLCSGAAEIPSEGEARDATA